MCQLCRLCWLLLSETWSVAAVCTVSAPEQMDIKLEESNQVGQSHFIHPFPNDLLETSILSQFLQRHQYHQVPHHLLLGLQDRHQKPALLPWIRILCHCLWPQHPAFQSKTLPPAPDHPTRIPSCIHWCWAAYSTSDCLPCCEEVQPLPGETRY